MSVTGKMMRGNGGGVAIRVVEALLGAVFLLAAVLKMLDANLFVAQIFQYQVFSNPTLLGITALVTLFTETALGLMMLLGIRLKGLVPALVLAMLLFFTVLIAWAWPDDCGCFGKVKMGPEVSIAKNIVMMAAAIAILVFARKEEGWPRGATGARVVLALLAGMGAVAYAYPQVFQDSVKSVPSATPAPPAPDSPKAAMPADAPESPADTPATPAPAPSPAPAPPTVGPYSGYVVESEFGEQFDLSQGDYLVATLSMTCEHCMESVPTLNELAMDPTLPKLVAIVMENDAGDKESFIAQTQAAFPMLSIGNNFLEFSKLMADAPPRLALVRNGSSVITWDKEFPPAPEITSAVNAALAGVPTE